MSEETKKISFGFSKVSKKSNLILNKKEKEIKNDIQFIECLEEKSIKVVGGEEKEKAVPIIPMRNGNSLKENIREVVKLRAQKKSEQDCEDNETSKEDGDKAPTFLTLDDLAARELLEDLKKSNDNKKEYSPTVALTTKVTIQDKESTLEDYENMPIVDFGLAMLRGMGWNPKKGIGLNEKLVAPLAPTLRPKGMGLGADKVPNSKNVTSNGEVLIMKKGATVKIVSGPHNNLYGKIEGFDELPGRLMVRIAESSVIVSLNEIMVQLVSTYEYNKNIEIESVQTLRTEKLNRPEYSHEKSSFIKKTTSKSHFLNNEGTSEMDSSNYTRNSRDQENLINENNGKEQLETKKPRKHVCKSSDFDNMEDKTYIKKGRKTGKRNSSSSLSDDSCSSYKQVRYREKKKYSKSRRRDLYKESKFSKKSYNFTSSESSKRNRNSSRRDKYESSSSSDSRKKDYAKNISKNRKGKRSVSSDSSNCSDFYRKSHSKKYYKR